MAVEGHNLLGENTDAKACTGLTPRPAIAKADIGACQVELVPEQGINQVVESQRISFLPLQTALKMLQACCIPLAAASCTAMLSPSI
jgi:hypothetical protein